MGFPNLNNRNYPLGVRDLFKQYSNNINDEGGGDPTEEESEEVNSAGESKYTYIGGNTTNAKQENTIQDIWDNSITNPEDFNLSCGTTRVYSEPSENSENSETFKEKSIEISTNKNEIRKTFIYTDDTINSQKETKKVSHHKDIVSKQVNSLKRSETFFYVVIAFIILFTILLGFLLWMR